MKKVGYVLQEQKVELLRKVRALSMVRFQLEHLHVALDCMVTKLHLHWVSWLSFYFLFQTSTISFWPPLCVNRGTSLKHQGSVSISYFKAWWKWWDFLPFHKGLEGIYIYILTIYITWCMTCDETWRVSNWGRITLMTLLLPGDPHPAHCGNHAAGWILLVYFF